MSGDELRAAEGAHTRLLAGMDAEHLLSRTTHEALRTLAHRTHTEHVPQIAEALRALRERERDR